MMADNRTRKQAIQEFKEKEMTAGVYQIRNTRNEKIFIHSSLNLQTMNGQRFQLKMGSHLNRALQEDWNQYGEECFAFEVLELLDRPAERYDPRDDLKKLAEKWMEKLQPFGERGYHKP